MPTASHRASQLRLYVFIKPCDPPPTTATSTSASQISRTDRDSGKHHWGGERRSHPDEPAILIESLPAALPGSFRSLPRGRGRRRLCGLLLRIIMARGQGPRARRSPARRTPHLPLFGKHGPACPHVGKGIRATIYR